MINEARTLLLNVAGPSLPGTPGEEYVPDDYRPKQLPPELATVYRLLFGTAPDRAFLNFRARQLLTLVHATELDEHLRALDSRITYLPAAEDTYDAAFTTKLTQVAGPRCRLYLDGYTYADERLGRTDYRWQAEVLSETSVRVVRRPPETSTVTHDVAMVDGLLPGVPLQGSSFKLRIGVERAGDDVTGVKVLIDTLARPVRNLSDIYAALREGLGPRITEALFGVTLVEPYRTFANLWNTNPHMPYALGGLLTAYIYRLRALERR